MDCNDTKSVRRDMYVRIPWKVSKHFFSFIHQAVDFAGNKPGRMFLLITVHWEAYPSKQFVITVENLSFLLLKRTKMHQRLNDPGASSSV